MEARIVGFKGSRRDMDNKYGIIEGVPNPASLIGQTVNWQTEGGRFISGKVVRTHGSRGAMARFSRGLPGTALGSVVIIGRAPAVVKEAPKKPVRKVKPVAKKPVVKKKHKAEKKPAKAKKAPEKRVEKPTVVEKAKVVEKAVKKPKAKGKEKAPAKKEKSAKKASPKPKSSKKK